MRRLAASIVLALAACAAPQPAPVETSPPPAVEQPAPSSTARESVAVAGLLDSARSDAAAGRLAEAAATLERALRIEPRNPRL
jgi:Flp pilus assembly protein TadD